MWYKPNAMKNTLICCLFLCLIKQGNAQNAFYRAQKILVWQDSIMFINGQFDNGGLKPEDASRRKNAFLDSINPSCSKIIDFQLIFFFLGYYLVCNPCW